MEMRKWKRQWLKKVIPLVLTTGVFLAVPYVGPVAVQQDIPAAISMAKVSAAPMAWNLEKNMGGWKFGGVYSYAKEPNLADDARFDGSIRLGLDFTANASDGDRKSVV